MPKKAWIVAVDMGYGHQRAAYPLRLLAPGGSVVNADHYSGIPHKDRRLWRQGQEIYSFMSRFKSVPVVGEVAWDLYDQIQEIPPFYPKRDLSKPTMQVKSTYGLIRKKQWGAHFIQHLAKGHPLSSVSRRQGAGFIKKFSKQPIPFINTFFIPAFQAEEFIYPGNIYLVVCDADISRAWAPLVPARSRIRYLAPTQSRRKVCFYHRALMTVILLRQREAGEGNVVVRHAVELQAFHHALGGSQVPDAAARGNQRRPGARDIGVADDEVNVARIIERKS